MTANQVTIGQFIRSIRQFRRGALLLGNVSAGVASDYVGHIGQIESEVREQRARARGEVTSGADWAARVSMMTSGASGGDITGASGRKGRKARTVGAGIDGQAARAKSFEDWQTGADLAERILALDGQDDPTARATVAAMEHDLAELRDSRAAIVAAILAESDIGRRILTLAGGAGYGSNGRGVNLQSGGMAARAARYVWRLRGATPSDTSLADGAAEATAAMWLHWTALESVDCAVWSDCTMRHLASMGWRAAFQSFRGESARGFHGSRADEPQVSGDCVSLDTAARVSSGAVARCIWDSIDDSPSAVELESLQSWATGGAGAFTAERTTGRATVDDCGRVSADGAEPEVVLAAQRRKALAWVRDVLDVRAGGRTGAAERARFSVLARLINGRDIATSAHGAGFSSGRAALESFRSGKVWERLGAAIGQRVTDRDRRLQAARARAVKLAVAAIGAQRAARAGAGSAVVYGPFNRRRVVVASGAACIVRDTRFVNRARVIRPAARRVIVASGVTGAGAGMTQAARDWQAATELRAGAVATARAARRALILARSQRLADFKKGTDGLRRGWLGGNGSRAKA